MPWKTILDMLEGSINIRTLTNLHFAGDIDGDGGSELAL
jgi:hypothetical protein